jgi:hypothetical protein
MRHHPTAIVLLTAAIAACGDATGPTRRVTLSFCSGTIWAGVQNAGRDWVTVADRPSDATIDVSQRLVVATITGGSSGQLAFYYLTRDQARETFVCPATGGTKQLSGSVAGTNGLTEIAMGKSAVYTAGSAFSLRDLPDGPLDLVAVNARGTIVRRRVNYPDGATIPVLDFSSAEAFARQSHTLAVEPPSLGAARWETWITTNGGTRSLLTSISCCAPGTISTLPASQSESGDLYHLAVARSSGSDTRLVDRFYDAPSDQTVVFGPPASRATITTVVGPGQLWRAEVPSQAGYASQIEIVVQAPQPPSLLPGGPSVAIKASAEYFGEASATWTFTIPDLSTVAGFPAEWPIVSSPARWRVTASEAPWLFSPSRARAGDVYRTAITDGLIGIATTSSKR